MEKISVLIVDDHPMVLEGMKALLASFDYIAVVGTACNAFEAMDKLKTKQIDIAIVDNNLPEVNGIELTGKINYYHGKHRRFFLRYPRGICLQQAG